MHKQFKNIKALRQIQAILLLVIVTIVASVGIYFLSHSHAATPVIALEPENGTLATGATVTADTTASGGKAVKFTQSSTPLNGTEAAVKYGWGTPVSVENMDTLTNFNLYTAASDWGHKLPANITLSNGIATISGKSDGTTGGMSHHFSQKYGKWEARMQASGTQGCWRPVLLLWRDTGTTAEIDYSESAGYWTYTRFFLHYGGGQTTANVNIDATQWNNYAVEWTPTVIRGYVNGVQFFEDTNTAHFPDTTMHETFQLDAQSKSGTCNVDSQMKIDWLKVYK